MIYLASPYAHADPAMMQYRYEVMLDVVAYYLNERVTVFSPIVHCHNIKLRHGLPEDHDFWLRYDYEIMARCTGIYIIMLDGWMESRGVGAEIVYAQTHGMEITYIRPEEILGKDYQHGRAGLIDA